MALNVLLNLIDEYDMEFSYYTSDDGIYVMIGKEEFNIGFMDHVGVIQKLLSESDEP